MDQALASQRSHGTLSAATLRLNGFPSEGEGEGEGMEEEGGESEAEEHDPEVKPAAASDPKDNLRAMYWTVIHEQQKLIKKEHPNLSGREVLKRARAAFLD